MAPYSSDQQRKWAHTAAGLKALGGKEKVAEWDAVSRGMKLPKKAPKMKSGGSPIHINPANKGKLTATEKSTGKSAEELSHSGNELTRKRAQFALNAKHFKHMAKGGTPGYADGTPMDLSMLSDAQKTALDAVTDPAMKAGLYQQFIGGIDKLKTIAPTAVDATQTAMDAKTSMSGGVDAVKKPSGVTDTGIGVAADIAGRAIVNGNKTDATTAGAAGVLKGVSEGAAFGPWGMAVGALLEGIPAVIGANKAKNDLKIKKNNSAMANALANQDTPNYTGKSLRSGGAPIPIRVQGGNKKTIDELSDGGSVNGAGTAKSDSIKAKIDSIGFIVPAENSSAAEVLRATYLGAPDKKAKLKNGGAGKTDVKLSDGEHYFTAAETALLTAKGVNLNALAPNANVGNKLAAGGTPDKGVFDIDKFAEDVLKKLNIPVTDTAKNAIKTWAKHEGNVDGKGFNPLNTKWQKVDATNRTNAGVKDYKTYEDGVNATVKTLKSPNHAKEYQPILDSLKTGDSNAVGTAVLASPWGTKTWDKSDASFARDIKANTNVSKSSDIAEQIRQEKLADAISTVKENSGYDIRANKEYQGYMEARQKQDYPNLPVVPVSAPPPAKIDEAGNPVITKATSKDNNIDPNQAEADAAGARAKSVTENYDGEDKAYRIQPKTPGVIAVTSDAQKTLAGTEGYGKEGRFVNGSGTDEKGVNAGTVLAGAQTALGIANLVGAGKRPVDKIDPNLLNSEQEAIQEANYGLTPVENAKISADLELNRRTTAAQVLAAGGGDQASAFSGLTEGQQVKNRGVIDLGVANQREMARKKVYRDSLITEVANKKRQLFEDNMNAFEQNQGASADLMNAGLGNLFGSLKSEKFNDALASIK